MTRDQFIAANPISAVLAGVGVKCPTGRNSFKVSCPFHRDKKPSLSIDLKCNLWNCHAGCGKGGVIDLIMKLENLSFVDFAKKYDVTSEQRSGFRDRQSKSLFSTLKIKREPIPIKESEPEEAVIEKVYSYQNQFGQEVFQCVRYKPKDFRQRHKEEGEWVWNLRGVERVLYRLPQVLKSQEIWLVEGEKDADNLHDLSFIATTSPMGASSWVDGYSEYLKGRDIVLCGDTDDAGKEYVQTIFSSLTGKAKSVRVIDIPSEFKDVTDFIESFKKPDEAREALQQLKESTHSFVKGYRITVKTMSEMQPKYKELIANKKRISFDLGSWLPDLSELRALVPGEVVLIVGGTGVGKTAIGSNIALAATPLPTLFFELELPDELLFERLVASRHNLTCSQVEEEFNKGLEMTHEELEVLFKNLFICSESVQSVQDIEEQIAHCELKTGVAPKVVVIDYVQLIVGKGDRRERISDAAEEIKRMAKRRKVIVILISQISRPGVDQVEVTLYSAKESGSLENSSGLVLGIWRDQKDSTLLHGRVLKNTKGKAGKRFRMNFDGDKMIIGPRGSNLSDAINRVKSAD